MKTHSLDDLRRREDKLRQITSRRTTLEYLAGGTGAALFLIMGALTLLRAEITADFIMASGFIALAIGLLVPICRLFYTDRSAAGDLGLRLERERKLLSSAWLWYVAPMAPGFVLFHLGYWLTNSSNPTFPILSGGLALIFLIGLVVANRYAARKLERAVEDIDMYRQMPR